MLIFSKDDCHIWNYSLPSPLITSTLKHILNDKVYMEYSNTMTPDIKKWFAKSGQKADAAINENSFYLKKDSYLVNGTSESDYNVLY